MSSENLTKRFAEAGLTLEVTKKPFVGTLARGGTDIVQIDIQRKFKGNARSEYFRIWPGNENNRIEVLSYDKKLGQVILMVHEPPREFEEQVPWRIMIDTQARSPDGWVELLKSENGYRKLNIKYGRNGKPVSATVVRNTPSRKRHFLAGVDERQLFICQLPRAVSTVKEAHASLKSPTVVLAEGRNVRTVRQGEWFFLMPSDAELREIDAAIKKNFIKIETKCPIGPMAVVGGVRGGGKRIKQRGGNPHTADELVVLFGRTLEHGHPVRVHEVYVRGKVRHVDHATVSFSTWRKVIRNTEANEGRMDGVLWVD